MTLARQAGSAVFWRGLSLSIEKIIFLLRILVLARILAPADFGLVAIGLVSLAMLNSLTNFGIVPALIQQPARHKRYLDTAWTIGLIRGAGINVVMFFAAPYIAEAFDQPDVTNIIRVLALSTLLQSAASIEIANLTRELKFKRLLVIRLAAVMSNTVVSIMLARKLGAWALVWGTIAGYATHLLVSYVCAPYRPRFRLQGMATTALMRFGRWIFLIGVVGVAADGVLRWIITHRLGVTELGLYFMAARLAYLPYQLITEIVSAVAFPLYAQLGEGSWKTTYAFRTVFISTLALLLPISAIMIVLIPDLVTVVLGERWQGATVVMQFLIVASIAGVAGDTIVPLLKGVGQPQKVAILDMLQLLALCPAAWVLVGRYGLAGAGLATLIAVVLSQAFAIHYVRGLIHRPFFGTGRSCFAILASALAGALVSLLLIELLSGSTALIVAGSIGTLAAIATGLCMDRVFELRVLNRIAEPFPAIARFVPNVRVANRGGGNRYDD